MKKLFYAFALLIGFGFMSYAQDKNVAITEGLEQLEQSKASGDYSFTLPGDLTNEELKNRCKYYTSTLNFEYDESSKEVEIHVINNTGKNRVIIGRMLTACDVRQVKIGDELVSTSDFIVNYLR